ncbi:MAG TPA: hypothetical protein VMT17_16255 [Anaeromyxobacteraceae bacterium]|nr:hypothetical protein [Anaeromyxobacteraceae bacterium]
MDPAEAEPRRGLPAREPADHEVAAGAIGGLTGAVVMWLPAMLVSPPEVGALFPLRLVAASILGPSALDSDAGAFAALLGAMLAALVAVLGGLVFVSILPQSATSLPAVAAGAAYGAVLFGPAWYGLVRVADPILYAAGLERPMFALHVVYGAMLGLQVPFLRKVMP